MDIQKYKYYKFHKNTGIDFQIKALLLKFEFEVENLGLTEEEQVELIAIWINRFIEFEMFEYLEVFKKRKALLQSNVIFQSNINIDSVESKIFKMTLYQRVKTFFKSFLKKA